jgi:hypothetical protein
MQRFSGASQNRDRRKCGADTLSVTAPAQRRITDVLRRVRGKEA